MEILGILEMGEVSIMDYIDNTNEYIKQAMNYRSLLIQNNFYDDLVLTNLSKSIMDLSGIGSYLSSYIVYDADNNPSIRFTIRKSFFKRFGNLKNNSMEFYQYINEGVRQCFINNIYKLSGIIKDYPWILKNVTMMYTISRIDDTSILLSL